MKILLIMPTVGKQNERLNAKCRKRNAKMWENVRRIQMTVRANLQMTVHARANFTMVAQVLTQAIGFTQAIFFF